MFYKLALTMVDCLVLDVIETYKELVCWHLIIWPIDKLGSHLLFLCPKFKWKAFNEDQGMVYEYSYHHNQLCLIMDKLTIDFLNLAKKII